MRIVQNLRSVLCAACPGRGGVRQAAAGTTPARPSPAVRRRPAAPSSTRSSARATSSASGRANPAFRSRTATAPATSGWPPDSLAIQGFTVNVQQLGHSAGRDQPDVPGLAIQYGRNDVLAISSSRRCRSSSGRRRWSRSSPARTTSTSITAALGKGAGGANPTGLHRSDRWPASRSDFATLIAGIRVAVDVGQDCRAEPAEPGRVAVPRGRVAGAEAGRQRASVRITTTVINPTPDVTVIDLMCDPRLYQAANLSRRRLPPERRRLRDPRRGDRQGGDIRVISRPESSCAQMTLVLRPFGYTAHLARTLHLLDFDHARLRSSSGAHGRTCPALPRMR